MKALDIRNKYLKFFERNGHTIIKSASVIPENDSSVLFTTAGMQPLVPYLLGKEHPSGNNRLTDYQKCVRTNDIEEVGDNRHLTFFEMLGNWSLGAYFKEESIAMSFEFLTKELEIPVEKLSVTCFAGDEDCERDEFSAAEWKKAGIPEERIYFYGKSDNWWIAGEDGPCGPDTEIFYDTGANACSKDCQPSCDCGKYVEIWNNVFMEYFKDENGYRKLEKKNVDTGLGLERMTMLLQGKKTPYDTELFSPIMKELENIQKVDSIESRRIIAEHLRSSIMIISDGGKPSNTDRGYILRRLIRRMIRHINKLEIKLEQLTSLIELTIENLREMYPELLVKKEEITNAIIEEKNKFVKTLANGEREFFKELKRLKETNTINIPDEIVFKLYDTYGFPLELTKELAEENGYNVNENEFENLFKLHQEKSRQGAEQKFKGGLADQNEKTVAYHTTTHILHQALKKVLGDHVNQKGSNITEERLRFDFSHPEKMTKEQIEEVEKIVNEEIQKEHKIICEEMKIEEARQKGAVGLFEDKYEDTVKVYTIGDFSIEICGGPHVSNTKELGKFKIKKEESSSSGVRRIKGILN